MQTALSPGSSSARSIRASAKKCDLPDPRPPYAALNLAGLSSGRKTLAVGIFRVDDCPLDCLDPDARVFVIPHYRLRHLAV